jgi:hypothetical protein
MLLPTFLLAETFLVGLVSEVDGFGSLECEAENVIQTFEKFFSNKSKINTQSDNKQLYLLYEIRMHDLVEAVN